MHNTHNHSHKLTKCFDRMLIAITFFIVNTNQGKGLQSLVKETYVTTLNRCIVNIY